MADEEADQDCNPAGGLSETIRKLRQRLEELKEVAITKSVDSPLKSSSEYCQEFCRTLLEFAGCWRIEEEPLPVVQVYIVALLSYAKASPYLSLQCENVPLVAERLSLSFVELLLSVKDIPDGLWKEFKSSVQFAHSKLQENGITQLSLLSSLSQYDGVWTNKILQGLLSNIHLQKEQVEEFLVQEGKVLLQMRVKQLMKEKQLGKAALLAKTCVDFSAFQGKGTFKQMYLVSLCRTSEQNKLMDELSKEDCRDALDMICNLESDGDDSGAFCLCSAFLTRQLLQGDTYCAWELTLLWSKLLRRLEPLDQAFLERCRQLSLLSKSVYHILFLIKVIQSEIDQVGLPICIEMCIRALQIKPDDGKTKAPVCKTISCLLPADLEVKRACQLTEFLLEPTVDAYYAVEALYNEPDQKLEEENMPILNSLRCELLLVLKTQWSFDPEFWDWKTLKRHCLELMGEEASIVSSIDSLNDTENQEEESMSLKELPDHIVSGTYELQDITDRRRKNREMKKLREKGFISARFRNWQAYMQYCVLCDKEFLGHRIVRHAQTHISSGIYTCPICAQTFTSKDTLIPHVTSHVKQSCKERLTALKTNKKLANPKTAAPVIAAFKIKTLNELQKNGYSFGQNEVSVKDIQAKEVRCDAKSFEDNMCPVGKCRRSFKFLKNLIAHVKAHGENEEAKTFLEMQSKKVVCHYCRRHFVSVTHLNDHLQVHCGVKPYICIQLNCKASFMSNTELLIHRKTHPIFKAKCMFPNCGKVFNAAFKLYDHEAQHYKTFTCKVVDCGKVFHSQQQLDLHQNLHHSSEEEESLSSGQTSQNTQPSPSLSEKMLSNKSVLEPEHSQRKLNTESADNSNHGRPPVTFESFFKSTQAPVETLGQGKVKPEAQSAAFSTSLACNSNSVIKPVHSLVLEPNGQRYDFGDHIIPPQNNHPVPPFEASVGHLLQCQPQWFPSKVNTEAISCNSDCNLASSVEQGPRSSSNCYAGSLSQIPTEPAMSQPLPPSLSHQQVTGIKLETSVTSSNGTGPCQGQRERFHCAFGTCTRHYSSYRSVAKHMKAVHTDFYEQWKVARTKIKTTYAPAQSASSVEHLSSFASLQNQQANSVPVHGVSRQNVIQSPPYTDRGTSSNYKALHSLSSLAHNQNGSLLMANVLNPIVLSQLGTDRQPVTTQSQFFGNKDCHFVDGGEQIRNCESSQVFPSKPQVTSQVNFMSGAPSLSSCSVTGSVMNRPEYVQSQLMNRPQFIRTSDINGAKEVSQQTDVLPSCTSQMQHSLVSHSETPEKIKARESYEQSNHSFLDITSQNAKNCQPQNGPVISENNCGKQKPARKNKRTKWPAIIKDGKFVCRRCFRQFDSPKSLGGHLSKRTICKPYQESELKADLQGSFLNFLNSEQIVCTSKSQQSYNGAVYQKPHETETRGLPDAKDYSAPNYPQNNIKTCGNAESNYDILRQIMAESNLSDLFVQTSVSQPLLQHLHGGLVAQHTETVQPVQEDSQYRTAHYPQQSSDKPPGEFPDPLLSQILTENPSTSIRGSAPTNNTPTGELHGEGYYSETTIRTPKAYSDSVVRTLLPDRQLSQAITMNKQTEKPKTTETDIKRRLREQILAGDFQRRNSMCLSVNTCAKALSSGPAYGYCNHSEFNQLSDDTITDSSSKGQVIKGCPETVTGFSGEIEQLLNTQSFTCFRDTVGVPQEVPSPAGIFERDPDPEPCEFSITKQQCMTEIQCAFERLDLVREMSAQKSTSMNENSAHMNSQTAPSKVVSHCSVSSTSVKPYACENANCVFSSLSSEALWKHLSKTHNYTVEMVNVVKKRYGQYARFKCQKCHKSFTRNSNLRTHYLAAHKLSAKEIADLDLNRKLAKAVASQKQPVGISQTPVVQTTATHSCVDSGTHLYPLQNAVKCEAFVPRDNTGIANHKCQNDNLPSVLHTLHLVPMHNQEMTAPVQAQTSAEHWTQNHQRNVPKVHTQHAGSQYFTKVSPPFNQDLPATPQAEGTLTHKNGSFSRQTVIQPNIDIAMKTKGRKPKSGETLSPYRPYRCVHQGCMAAFTIQHNLILHYRAVHQSAFSALEVNKELDQSKGVDEVMEHNEEETEAEFPQISEFRCQVKDCCCVFQEVPNLFQHYFQLHKFTFDKVGSLLSGIKLGKFVCGHKGCTQSFTTFWRYVGHVKEEHKDLNLTKPEQLNVSFRCEIEGCDRSYATKSNMLRHVMKKHQDRYQPKLKNQKLKEDGTKQNSKTLHYQVTKTSNGKENIESNQKILLRANKKRVGKAKNKEHWIKYGKPCLKSKLEASSLCTKKFPLQYPCMIKGCELVVKSERSMFKHYMGHGLSEKYLQQHRSHFIFCKKVARQKCHSIRRDDSKSDNTSDGSDNEMTAAPNLGGGKSEYSKRALRRRTPAGVPVALFTNKLSNDESSNGTVVLKRKRGRPRKLIEKIVKRKKILHMTKTALVYSREEESKSSCPSVNQKRTEQSAPLASFKPMGFEMSFLKFLEQSNKSERNVMRTVTVMEGGGVQASLSTKDSCVKFSNHQNLKSLCNVRINLDATFSSVTDPMLRQLQDMHPAVVLEKFD
ncbi:zinc finger protein 292b [Leuresthes tenuis]|uniref:zinc finger protein 292b n=1 Tax=Leuresthes tenuis TaxID=355514 RepID=UPI003B512973